jgi:GT2 family glycosyltransferase
MNAPGTPSHTAPLVYVVVLNWRRSAATAQCLRSLEQLDYEPREIVVVDNGSGDGSEAALRDSWPGLRLLQTGSNLGYAGGNNWGIRHALDAGADYVWVLNNDTLVEPETLTELVAAASQHERAGAIATRLVELEAGGTTASAFGRDAHTMAPRVCDGCDAGWHTADMLGGPSLLLRAAALREVGIFDEDYFHYYEEADLMERVRRGGWELGLACRAIVRHSGGASLSYASAQSQYYAIRNTLLYRRKLHGEHPLLFLGRHPHVARYALGLRRTIGRRDVRPSRAAFLGIVDAVRSRTGPRDLGERYQAALDDFVTFAPVDTTFLP